MTDIGIPPANYGYVMGKIEEVMQRKGLGETKDERELVIGGRAVAKKKLFTFTYGRTLEVIKAMSAVIDHCHTSRGWDPESQLVLVNRVDLGNAI